MIPRFRHAQRPNTNNSILPRRPTMTSRRKTKTNPSYDLQQRLLGYFETLRVPLLAVELG